MKLVAGRSQDIADISRMLDVAEDLQLGRVRMAIGRYLLSALESLMVLGRLEKG